MIDTTKITDKNLELLLTYIHKTSLFQLLKMSIIYSDKDGYFISHQLFISKLYEEILNKTENTVNFYEHFFHIDNPFVRDKQQVETFTENDGVKRKRKQLKFKVIVYVSDFLIPLAEMFPLYIFTIFMCNV